MLLPSHLLLGLSVGNLAYATQVFSGRAGNRCWSWRALSFWSCVAAISPDFDIFWSVYRSADPLIGHRGFSHSLVYVVFAALLLTAGACWIQSLLRRVFFPGIGFRSFLKSFIDKKKCRSGCPRGPETPLDHSGMEWRLRLSGILFFTGTMVLAGITHLYADLWQPPGLWHGIPLFWPFSGARSGGWAHMGWFDYRIVWLLLRLNIFCWILLMLRLFFRNRAGYWKAIAAATAVTVGIFWLLLHIRLQHKEFQSYSQWHRLQQTALLQMPEPVAAVFAGWRRFYQAAARKFFR